MPEHTRFLRGIVQWVGYKQTSLPYHADARQNGRPKYSLRRQVRLALQATVSFSSMPLYIFALFGLILAAVSFLYGTYAVIARFLLNTTITGWTSLLVSVTFMGGLQLISLGLIGAY